MYKLLSDPFQSVRGRTALTSKVYHLRKDAESTIVPRGIQKPHLYLAPKLRLCQHLHSRAKAYDVADQLTVISAGEGQQVGALGFHRTFLKPMQSFACYPERAFRSEARLRPSSADTTKDAIVGVNV